MQTDGELKIQSVRRNYLQQMENMKREYAIAAFEDAYLGSEPSEFDLVNWLANETEKGSFKKDMAIRMDIREEKDGIVIVWCDDSGNPLKID